MSGIDFDLTLRIALKKSKREGMNEPLGSALFVRVFLHKDYICYFKRIKVTLFAKSSKDFFLTREKSLIEGDTWQGPEGRGDKTLNMEINLH